MYKRVEAQLILSGLTRKDLAKELGISYNTLLLKLRRVAPFTLDEAFKVKQVTHATENIDVLFERTA